MASDLYSRCPNGCDKFFRFIDQATGVECSCDNGYVPVVSPAPTDSLRAAAQAYVAAREHQSAVFSAENLDESEWPSAQTKADNAAVEAFHALRAALDAPPVALTMTDLQIITTGILHAAGSEWTSSTSIAESFIDDIGNAGYAIVRRG